MCALLEVDGDITFVDLDGGGSVDEVSEEVPGFCGFVAAADPRRQKTVEAAGHEGELKIAVEFHRNGRRQRVHVEEIDAISDIVLDQHPLGIASDQVGGLLRHVVGKQKRRIFVSEFGDRDLADRSFVIPENHLFVVEDARGLVNPRRSLQFDTAPSGKGDLMDLVNHLGGPAPERDETDAHLVQLAEVVVGRELGVEDQLLGMLPGSVLPKLDEA